MTNEIKLWPLNYTFNKKDFLFRKTSSYLLGFALIFQPLILQSQKVLAQTAPVQEVQTQTEITADRLRRGRNPLQITQAGNGVTVVNIVTPNGSGLSHNKYRKFIVGQQGAILNNSNQDNQLSQLGGQLTSNQQLATSGPARVILNEVGGSNRSLLKGTIEVHGGQADVIIANPNGITCNGCGFINAPKVTLSTGQPHIGVDGALNTLNVTGGNITIGTNGAELQGVNIFNLVSRTISVLGPVRALDELNLIAGRNTYGYQTTEISAQSADGNEPDVAIDSSLLGGMYAGRIKIVSNDQGAGVNTLGTMVANANGVTLTANGQLTVKDVRSTKPTGGRQQDGAGDITITASRINLDRAVDDNTDALNAAGDITLNSGNISAQNNRITSLGTLNINSSSSLGLSGGIYYAGGLLQVEAASIANNAELNSENKATLSSTTGSIVNRGKVASNEGTEVNAATTLQNAGNLYSAKTVDIDSTGATTNTSTGNIFGIGNVDIDVASLDNEGTINTNAVLSIDANSINNGGWAGSARSHIIVDVINNITNTGWFYSGTHSIFELGGDFTNNTANIVAETYLKIRGRNDGRAWSITNSSGNIEAITGDITLKANTVTNKRSTVVTFDPVVSEPDPVVTGYTTTTKVITRNTPRTGGANKSRILAGRDIIVEAQTLDNRYSDIAANKYIRINANRINNEGLALNENVFTTTSTQVRRERCDFKFGICWNYHHWWETVTSTNTNDTPYDYFHGTFRAGEEIEGTVTGYRGNNAVSEGVADFSLSAGDDRTLEAVRLEEVSATKNLVDLD
jgi:filamentous hemagglutinin